MPPLSLHDNVGAHAAEQDGRRRLAGAFSISIHRIRPDPNQPRRMMDPAPLAELTASIRQHGILQPITVRYSIPDDAYFIIAGERRYRAALEAGLEELPCWIRTPRDADILVQQIVENWQRAELHPFDLADALAQLRDTGSHTQKDLAHLTGKSAGEISKLLSLLDFDATLQMELRADPTGALSKRHLYEVRKLDPIEQRNAVDAIPKHDQLRHELLLTDFLLCYPESDSLRGWAVNRHLRPDAEMTLNDCFYYVELDTGEQSYAQVRRRQIRYAGLGDFVLYVTQSARRLEGLRHHAHDAVKTIALFATLADVQREPHAAIWIDCLGEKTAI